MNRRKFVGTLASALGAAALRPGSSPAEEIQTPTGKIKAIAFDGFVIFDPRSIEKRVEEQLPGRGAEFTTLWRTRQFEYCWLRTAGNQYADFWHVTDHALRYTAKALKVPLTSAR